MPVMYILKTKGTARIPDYIQIRDENFILVTHFKASNLVEGLSKLALLVNDDIIRNIAALDYGILKAVEFEKNS